MITRVVLLSCDRGAGNAVHCASTDLLRNDELFEYRFGAFEERRSL